MARCQRRLGRLDEAEYSFKVLAGQPARLAMCVLDWTGPGLWLMLDWVLGLHKPAGGTARGAQMQPTFEE